MAAADEIAEKLAQKVSLTQNKLTLDREFNRIWKPQAGQLSAQVEAALNAITTVTDPQYENGTKSLPGLWRVAASGWNPQGQIYFQTLREGWASTVLNTTGVPNTLPDDEWMIQIGSDSRSDARSYTFLRRNVASTAINGIVAALRTLGSWTNPTVQGEAKTGSYAFANIIPQQQVDGSYWITIEAIRTATIAAISDLYPLSPIRQDSHDIENAFGLEGGFVGHIGNKPTDGIVLTFRALSVASRAVILSLTDSQLQGVLSNDEQLKYEFIKRDLVEDAGNTLKLSLAYQYIPLATTTPESAARKVSFKLDNQSGKLTLVRSWPRLDPAYSKDLLTANVNQKVTDGVVVDPMVDGVTYTGSWLARSTIGTMTGNDGDRIVQTMIKEGDQSLNLKYGSDPIHVTYELWRVDVSVAKIGDFMAQINSEAVGVGTPIDFKWDEPELGITKAVKIDWNEDRSANLHAIYSTANNLERVELFTAGTGAPGKLTVQDNYVSTTERGFGWNIPVSALKTYSDYYKPVVKVVNTKNEFRITRRDEHTFDFEGVLTTFIPIDSGDVIVEDTKEKTVTVRTGSFLTGGTYFTPDTGSYVRPTNATANVQVELDVKDNAYGSKDAVKKTTVFHEIDDGGIVIEDTAEKTVTRRTGSHILAAKIAAGQDFGPLANPVNGTEVVVDSKINDVQTYNVVRLQTVFHEQTGSASSTKGTIEAVAETTAKATATSPTLTADGVNKISAIEITPRKDGLKDTVKKDTTLSGKTLVSAVVVEKDAFHTKTLTKTVNGTTVTGPAAYGKTHVEHNGAGGTHTDLEEIAEVNAASQDVISTPLETVTIDKNSASAAAVIGTVSQNNGSKVSNKKTPGGNLESEKIGTVKTPWTSGALVITKNIGGVFTESMKRFRNSTTIPAATVGQMVKAIENELVSFDGEVIERNIVTGAGATGFITVGSSVYEWKERSGEMRFPVWTTSTDSSVPQRITGYNIFDYQIYWYRTVTVEVTRKYYSTHPSVTATAASGAGTSGGGTSRIKQVVELAEGLFAVDDKIVTVTDWTRNAPIWNALASVTA